MVSSRWGPRGFATAFESIRDQGFDLKNIWDVGASDASWTKECREVFPMSDYFLFEPLKAHRNQLTAIGATDSKIHFFPCALGDTNGSAILNAHKGQSSILTSQEWKGHEEVISIMTADDVIKQTGIVPDCVKIDVQGYELSLLRGFASNLRSCKFLLVEVSWIPLYENAPLADTIISFLAANNFHIVDICTYAQRPKDFRLTQSDVLFANSETGLLSNTGWS
ncbi:FkbM family methyltransferase [Pirellula sp. SH-Sr6A]|uniref:FkbM family methyltransferase n=1 Tax=Pirellula sp. SH-Sr6A TaxID=1632865 RepID=UPI0011BAC581